MAHKRIRCKNLETGKIAYHGDTFLKRQPKPVLADSGNYYENGVWVEDRITMSKPAQSIVEEAKKTASSSIVI